MRKSVWFPVTVVAFVLAGSSPALAQDIPDDATRARVADWIERCPAPSDACWPVIKRIEESARGPWCLAIDVYWDTARLVRDPETVLNFVEELLGRREKAKKFIAECVPIYAAALDEAGEGDDSSGDTAYRGPVEAADRVMQAVKRSNLRSGPGTTYGKVGLLDIGDEVRVTGVVGNWLRIAAPDGGEAFIYGPLLAEVTPDQVTATVERETEPAIALEPKCTAELPNGSECWQELTERPGCLVWMPSRAGLVATTWSGECAGGLAEGEGRLGLSTLGGVTRFDQPATFAGGRATELGVAVMAGSHAQQAGPPGEAPGTDAPSVDVTSGSGPLHGSIAFSQEDDGAYAWGIAWSFDTPSGALAESIDQCQAYGGSDCAEVGWFSEACGALAIGDGNGYGAGWGDSTAEAERDALSQCRAANPNCRIEVARCSQSEQAGGKGRTDEDKSATVVSEQVDLDPSCNDLATAWDNAGKPLPLQYQESERMPSCWREISERPGCHVYGLYTLLPTAWSGDCSSGVATEQGELLGGAMSGYMFKASGMIKLGKKHGRWAYQFENELGEGAGEEGSYRDGVRHGRWATRSRYSEDAIDYGPGGPAGAQILDSLREQADW